MSRYGRRFFRGMFERSTSSAAVGALSAWTLSQDWRLICSFSGLMAVYTALKCVAASEVGDKDSPSILKNAA
jgi:hypothetical protein